MGAGREESEFPGHSFGKGRVIWPRDFQTKPDADYDQPESKAPHPTAIDEAPDITIAGRALEQSGLPPDFKASTNLRYIHKRLRDTDVYFVANPEPRR